MSQNRSNKRPTKTKRVNISDDPVMEVKTYQCKKSTCTETFQSWENFHAHCAENHNIILPDNIRKRPKLDSSSTRPHSGTRREAAEEIRRPPEPAPTPTTPQETPGGNGEQIIYPLALKSRNGQFVCPICSTIFQHRHRFVNHLRAHESDTLPFPCEICGYSFADPVKVMEHVAIRHPQYCTLDPFVCGCGTRYKLNRHFQRHINKCTKK